jgi:hypothetical protein
MKHAILLTAYNRADYLVETLQSWADVRGIENWPVHVMLEPSENKDEMIQVLRQHGLPEMRVTVNPTRYGVLKNPYIGFHRLFNDRGYDFVFRIEDDVLVSDDILEYVGWAAEEFQSKEDIALVQAFSGDDSDDVSKVLVNGNFAPWNWGTWSDRWVHYIGPTWDQDYSTYNDRPGNQSGWDWNLNTRVLPSLNLSLVRPAVSRTDHIGAQGTHATGVRTETPSFARHREPVQGWTLA